MARVKRVPAEDVVINALKRLGCHVETVVPVQELQGDLGIDSTEMVELAALVGVTINPGAKIQSNSALNQQTAAVTVTWKLGFPEDDAWTRLLDDQVA